MKTVVWTKIGSLNGATLYCGTWQMLQVSTLLYSIFLIFLLSSCFPFSLCVFFWERPLNIYLNTSDRRDLWTFTQKTVNQIIGSYHYSWQIQVEVSGDRSWGDIHLSLPHKAQVRFIHLSFYYCLISGVHLYKDLAGNRQNICITFVICKRTITAWGAEGNHQAVLFPT